jgi:hypothetical protein
MVIALTVAGESMVTTTMPGSGRPTRIDMEAQAVACLLGTVGYSSGLFEECSERWRAKVQFVCHNENKHSIYPFSECRAPAEQRESAWRGAARARGAATRE